VARRTTRVEGLSEVFAKLKQLPAEIAGKNGGPVLRGLRAGGRALAKVASDNVRPDGYEPDRLKKSIKVSRQRRPPVRKGEGIIIAPRRGRLTLKQLAQAVAARPEGMSARDATNRILKDDEAPYAGVQEFGAPSQGIPAQGFMRRAADSSMESAIDLTRVEIGKAVDAAFRKLAKAKTRG
jgi:hypothetical protein